MKMSTFILVHGSCHGGPDEPGSPNTYSRDPPDPQVDWVTGLDVCVPGLPGQHRNRS